MSQEESEGAKPTASTALFSTPPFSQPAVTPPGAPKSKVAKTKDFLTELLDRAKFDEAVEHDREDYEKVLHQKRMASILNEIKFLEETEWMYPSVETVLGFKDDRLILLSTQYESAANLTAEAHMFRAARGTDRNS